MAILLSHMPRTRIPSREYGAEREAHSLVQWLNGSRNQSDMRRGYLRVAKIFGLLQQLDPIADAWRPAYRNPELMESDKKYQRLFTEAFAIADRLNDLLLRYRLTPHIEPNLGQGGVYVIWTATKSSMGAVVPIPAFGTEHPQRAMDEPGAIQRMLALSRSGYLDRVRTCVACEQWFYARFSHAKFCSQACQQRYFRSSEEFKEHKKRYMRTLRKRHSERDSRYTFKREGLANVPKKAR
jgi:hypothetical protein